MAFVSVSRSAFEQEGQRRVNNSAVVWPAWLSLKENGVSSQMSANKCKPGKCLSVLANKPLF